MSPIQSQQITARQAVAPTQRQSTFQPQGRTVNEYMGAAEDQTLSGLVNGLKAFNPALENYVQMKNVEAAQDAYQEGATQGNLSDANAQVARQPNGIQVPPLDTSDRIQPAFSPAFATGYRRAVGAKIGSQIQNDILTQYQTNKNADGFDPEAFLKEQVATHTAGLTDPDIVSAVSKSVADISKRVRGDYAQVQYESLKTNATQTLSSLIGTAMDPAQTAQQQYDSIVNSIEPVRAQMGLQTRAELARMVFDQAHANSLKNGGQPEAFDVFTQFKDPNTGLSLVDMNPQLKPAVEQTRLQALNAQKQRVQEGQQVDFFNRSIADESSAKAGLVPDLNEFVQRIGPMNQYRTADAALSDWNHLNKLADTAKVTAASITSVGNGTAWGLTREHAQKAMDTALEPDAKVLLQAASSAESGDYSQVPEVQQAIRSIVDITGRSGRSDIANTKLKGLIDGTINAVPPKDGLPSSQFKLAAALYAGLPDQVRGLYFDEKAELVFSSYQRQRESGVSDGTAYHSAYASMSPEGIKMAQEIVGNAQWKERVTKHVSGLTTPLYQRIPLIGRAFGGAPENAAATSAWARIQLQDYYMRNPTVSEDQAMRWVEGKVRSNFVYDPIHKVDLQVPPNQASPQTQEAIAAYINDARNRFGEGANPGFVYSRDGRYQLVSFFNGAPIHKLEDVSFEQIVNAHAAKTFLTDAERGRMSDLRIKLGNGQATIEDLALNSEAISKATALGAIGTHMLGQLEKVRADRFKTVSDNVFRFPTTPVDFSGLSGGRLTGQGSKLQVRQANYFLGNMNYSAALTAMGEGLVLTATQDPNPKAGKNIGYGYNLNANNANIGEDFRRAGIPISSLDGIKDGSTQITPEQAARLLEVSLPRYAERAQKAVNAIQPNLWGNLNGNQKAALTDVAYQVGDVKQFNRALGALASGNHEAFANELKVTYASKDGVRVEDVRRNKLRSLMIHGVSAFSQGIAEAGRTSQ